MCESYFNVLPICAEIYVWKLLLLGWLCRINPKMLTKNIFLTRLFSYFHDLSTNQLGFIPDIMNYIQLYYLNDHLWTFLDDGLFSWKTFLEKNCTWQSDGIRCFPAANTYVPRTWIHTLHRTLYKLKSVLSLEDTCKLPRNRNVFCAIIHFPACFNILHVPVHLRQWFAKTAGTRSWTVSMCGSLRNCVGNQ